jgi:3-dehydroquinate synthase
MVDASVGGKTGVNLRAGDMLHKNFVGAFHQPRLVVASVDTLASLDDRQFRAGLAECIKHTMVGGDIDPELGRWTADHLDRVLARDEGALIELIARNVAVKAAIVAGDERETAETGGRALLNLGHTFAHAIETIDTLSPDGVASHAPLLHGEAVALGLVAASATASAMGRVDPGFVVAAEALIGRAGLPTRVAGLPPTDTLLARMAHDKKAIGGVQRLVLPAAPGRAGTVRTPPRDAVSRGIERIRLPA